MSQCCGEADRPLTDQQPGNWNEIINQSAPIACHFWLTEENQATFSDLPLSFHCSAL